MKKIMFLLVVTVLFKVGLYALSGTAYITPEKVARGSYSETIAITYNSDGATFWYNGALEIIIPEEFPDLPSLTIGARGEIKCNYLRGGLTIEPIPDSNILIDGRAITITAINLSPNDIIKIIYGITDNGGGGVQAPFTPGIYYFLMFEKITETSSFTPLDEQPSIEVTMIDITKSANVTSVMSKDTFTYTLTYRNISNMYPVDQVYIWDTLPQGLRFISSDIPPVFQDNNYLLWNIGTLFYNISGNIQIIVEALPGIIDYGQRLTNTAKIEAMEGHSYIYSEESETSIEVFGAKLLADIYAIPSFVNIGEMITVIMNVENQGNYHSYNVSPTALTINASGTVDKINGPSPSYVSILSQGSVTTFTWIYMATGAGSIYFSGRALGQENSMIVESNVAYSNVINIIIPINTTTPVITFTLTPMHTKTFTRTQTPSPTDTQQEAITPTFTNTEVIVITPTFTETIQTGIDTPTPEKTIISTATPDALVYVDRNHFKPEKGEKIKVHYKVLTQGIVDVKIYNLNGEIIISYSKNYPYVTYDYFYWDGKNNAGKIAGRGIYFIVIKQKSQIVMKKVVVLK